MFEKETSEQSRRIGTIQVPIRRREGTINRARHPGGCYGAAGQVQVSLEMFLSIIVHFVTPGGFCNVALAFLVDLSAIAFTRLTPES
jgi:hypothetical protein